MPRKKSAVRPPGIDPGTFRLVAQYLNHYAKSRLGGSSTVHIYTQTLHRIQRTETHNNKKKNIGKCGLEKRAEMYDGHHVGTK
jgi:hypothetical protein